jgi:hypothetical protein
MTEYPSPPEVSDDPHFCYRSGLQHGAWAVLEALRLGADLARLRSWAEVDLQQWVHDQSKRKPPAIPGALSSPQSK